MPAVTKSLGEGTQSVLLTVAILESLAAKPGPVGISDLARDIGTSKSRVFRHLQTLMACDYVARHEPSGEYEVGSRLIAFCRSINERYDLVALAEPIMLALRERFGHTVIVSRVDASGVRVLKSIVGTSPIVLEVRPGTILPFDRSAQGRIALAMTPPAWRPANSPLALAYGVFAATHEGELEEIARQGWAAAQMRQGLNGIAAPVFDASGRLVATLGLLDTVADIGLDIAPARIEALQAAAVELGRAMTRGTIGQ